MSGSSGLSPLPHCALLEDPKETEKLPQPLSFTYYRQDRRFIGPIGVVVEWMALGELNHACFAALRRNYGTKENILSNIPQLCAPNCSIELED